MGRSRPLVVRIAAVLVVAAAAVAALAAVPAAPAEPGSRPGPTSIVQLGDSVASGEGTLYGYRYDPATEEWTGGDPGVTWPGPYPACHVSPDAYGNHVARYFGATLHQFACTGASFANGIRAPELSGGTQLRPAEFGDWMTRTDLNPDYDAARPDLVLVTFGADDVRFHDIVAACVENGYEYEFDLAPLECVAGNPGATVERDYFAALTSLRQHYQSLVQWVRERALASGAPVPKVLFTTYPDPLPRNGAKCPDDSWLVPSQVRYLSSLVRQMNTMIVDTVESIDADGLGVVDLTDAYVSNGVDHRWCSRNPWAYGLSIFHVLEPSSFSSQAPFHPTPAGQRAIATHVVPAVRKLFG